MGCRFDHTRSEPAIYDTNIWVFGLTGAKGVAVDLIDAAVESAQFVAVPAYVFEEVRETFESGRAEPKKSDAHLTDFATIVHGNPNISDPSLDAVRNIDLSVVRQSPQAQSLGAATGSQPKDAPILWHAFGMAQEGRKVTIYTNDRQFSTCTPPPVSRDGGIEMVLVE